MHKIKWNLFALVFQEEKKVELAFPNLVAYTKVLLTSTFVVFRLDENCKIS